MINDWGHYHGRECLRTLKMIIKIQKNIYVLNSKKKKEKKGDQKDQIIIIISKIKK